MILRKRQRLAMALLIVACLLFQQVAMAAYACTMTQVPANNAAAMSGDCTAMATPQPLTAVCEKHCSPDPTSANGQGIPVPPALALPPVVHGLVLFQASRITKASDVPFARFDPPPRLRYCRLLI